MCYDDASTSINYQTCINSLGIRHYIRRVNVLLLTVLQQHEERGTYLSHLNIKRYHVIQNVICSTKNPNLYSQQTFHTSPSRASNRVSIVKDLEDWRHHYDTALYLLMYSQYPSPNYRLNFMLCRYFLHDFAHILDWNKDDLHPPVNRIP